MHRLVEDADSIARHVGVGTPVLIRPRKKRAAMTRPEAGR